MKLLRKRGCLGRQRVGDASVALHRSDVSIDIANLFALELVGQRVKILATVEIANPRMLQPDRILALVEMRARVAGGCGIQPRERNPEDAEQHHQRYQSYDAEAP